MVLAILFETTDPIFSFLIPFVCAAAVSAIAYPLLASLRGLIFPAPDFTLPALAGGPPALAAFGAALAFAVTLGFESAWALALVFGLAAALALASADAFAASSGCSSRSRKIVSIRARSLRIDRTFFSPSIWPMRIWNRSRNICSPCSPNCFLISAVSRARALSAFSFIVFLRLLPRNQLGWQRQLGRGQLHRLFRDRPRHAFHLKQNLPGTNHAHPLVRRAFPFSHTSFRRLLGDRLVL